MPSIYFERAVNQMAQLPGIGRKTAMRLVLHLLRRDREDVETLAAFPTSWPTCVIAVYAITYATTRSAPSAVHRGATIPSYA